jgi:hypothetical protein
VGQAVGLPGVDGQAGSVTGWQRNIARESQ